MLVVSKANRYAFVGIPTIDRDTSLRTGQEVHRGIVCDFRPFGIPEWAREQAAEALGYPRGVPHDEDPALWFGFYDTDAQAKLGKWTDAEKAEVESRLVEHQGTDFTIVEKPKFPPPWPAYDRLLAQGKRTIELIAEKIVEKVKEDGYDPQTIIEYESENLNRPAIISALRELQKAEEEELVAA